MKIRNTQMSAIICFAVVLSLCAKEAFGQKRVMKLDADLKANSVAMEAVAKAISVGIRKYRFGDYAIVSAKEGWSTTTTKSRFFSAVSESQSEKKISFILVGHALDTVLVNVAINSNLKEIDTGDFPIHFEKGEGVIIGSWSELKESAENYLAEFSFEIDTTEWELALLTRMGTEVEGGYQFEGLLTNGLTQIEIRLVREWNEEKKSAYNLLTRDMLIGYEFSMNGQVVGAVQTSMDSFQKKMVWIRQGVDRQVELVLAAASATLMIRTETTGAR